MVFAPAFARSLSEERCGGSSGTIPSSLPLANHEMARVCAVRDVPEKLCWEDALGCENAKTRLD
jgi:hypothetical protein